MKRAQKTADPPGVAGRVDRGLPNHASLLTSLRKRCTVQKPLQRFALVLMNIDRFKLFNEAHGHSMGDEVLRTMGVALRKALEAECQIMRSAVMSSRWCRYPTAAVKRL